MSQNIASHAFALAAADASTGPQWVHLIPAGRVEPRDGREHWTLKSAQAVITAALKYAAGKGLPVDYEHQIDNASKNGKPAPAAGWITKLESRTDGVWGLVEWTAKAAAHIAAREYRFISPVITFDAATREITGLLRAGLTNSPALNLTALARSDDTMTDTPSPVLDQLRQIFGLAADAADEDLISAARDRVAAASAEPDPARYVPIALFAETTARLNATLQGVTEEAATSAVNEAIRTGKMAPFMRDWATALCTTNKPAFDAFIAETGESFAHLFKAKSPAGRLADALGDDLDAEVARNLGLNR